MELSETQFPYLPTCSDATKHITRQEKGGLDLRSKPRVAPSSRDAPAAASSKETPELSVPSPVNLHTESPKNGPCQKNSRVGTNALDHDAGHIHHSNVSTVIEIPTQSSQSDGSSRSSDVSPKSVETNKIPTHQTGSSTSYPTGETPPSGNLPERSGASPGISHTIHPETPNKRSHEPPSRNTTGKDPARAPGQSPKTSNSAGRIQFPNGSTSGPRLKQPEERPKSRCLSRWIPSQQKEITDPGELRCTNKPRALGPIYGSPPRFSSKLEPSVVTSSSSSTTIFSGAKLAGRKPSNTPPSPGPPLNQENHCQLISTPQNRTGPDETLPLADQLVNLKKGLLEYADQIKTLKHRISNAISSESDT